LLHLKGIEYEIVEEPLRKWTKWMQDWSHEHNERARVPILRLTVIAESGEEKETVMPESNEIDLFLDALDGEPEFTPEAGSVTYGEMMNWWNWCDRELKPMIDLYKYGEDRIWDKELNKIHTKELRKYIQKLEDHLKDHPYLVEECLTLADIAVIPFIRQIIRTREGEFDFNDFPHVLAWANTILKTDWFENEVMKKYPIAEIGK
jgi:glutathione S-transferase